MDTARTSRGNSVCGPVLRDGTEKDVKDWLKRTLLKVEEKNRDEMDKVCFGTETDCQCKMCNSVSCSG